MPSESDSDRERRSDRQKPYSRGYDEGCKALSELRGRFPGESQAFWEGLADAVLENS